MTFRKFAFNNVIRNKRLYAAYFLSCMFTVMVFFTFAIFAFHPELSGSEMNSSVASGMNIAAGIIYVFSFFFILYSMSSFLQSRKREFGLLMMQGMTMGQIRSMVFLENMIIGFFATIGGISIGLVFAKAILLIAENVLVFEERLNFYFPIHALLLTFISFIVLFFFISLLVSYVLRSRKLIDLIKGNKVSRGEPKANLFLTIAGALLLGIGYAVALLAEGLAVIAVMLPVIVVVIIGTYLLFTQLSVYIIRILKSKESIFWRKTNMILFSDLSFRMKDNARTFFMVAIVSTVSFSAIGTLFGFQTLLMAGTNSPYAITYTSNENEEQDLALINGLLKEEKIQANWEQIPLQYHDMGLKQYTLIIKESDYNQFATLLDRQTIEVQAGHAKVVGFEEILYGFADELMDQDIILKSGDILKPDEMIQSNIFPFINGFYVVTDEDYHSLPPPQLEENFYAWHLEKNNQSLFEISKKLYDAIPSYKISVNEYETYEINKRYGPVLFVGLFIGIVFFVSAGSFLYFRLYMDVDDDKQKFKAIYKMGLTTKELKKVLSRQTAILFFTPIIVALIHGAVALTALSHMFYYNLFSVSVSVLSVFLLIQIIYFFIVRFYYTRQIQAALV